jgi:hypothetical protein
LIGFEPETHDIRLSGGIKERAIRLAVAPLFLRSTLLEEHIEIAT